MYNGNTRTIMEIHELKKRQSIIKRILKLRRLVEIYPFVPVASDLTVVVPDEVVASDIEYLDKISELFVSRKLNSGLRKEEAKKLNELYKRYTWYVEDEV